MKRLKFSACATMMMNQQDARLSYIKKGSRRQSTNPFELRQVFLPCLRVNWRQNVKDAKNARYDEPRAGVCEEAPWANPEGSIVVIAASNY